MIIATAALHYLAIIPFYYYGTHAKFLNYIFIIFVASSASIAYHIDKKYIVIDYVLAMLWTACDYELLELSIHLNIIVALLHFSMRGDLAHSLWHILSAAKCLYIAINLNQ